MPDLLLLDEPTSHLDLYTQLSLEKTLNMYDGSVIMVSHDYYMIINTMDYVLMIDDIQYYSTAALYSGSGTVTSVKEIKIGPLRGDYCVDIKILLSLP